MLEHLGDSPNDSGTRPFEVAQLALGWSHGLRRIVAASYPVRHAIITACRLRDHESLSILLETPMPIFSADPVEFEHINCVFCAIYMERQIDHGSFDLILAEYIRRRNDLKHLAMSSLPIQQHEELGIDEQTMLDSEAEDIFHSLKQCVPVPESLDCWISPYQMTRDCRWMPLSWLNKFYDAGFQSVDIPYQGDTPLLWRLAYAVGRWFESTWKFLPWFLRHGARADWTGVAGLKDTRYPTALFYIVLIWRHHADQCGGFVISDDPVLNACKESLPWVATTLHTISDDCNCFCGSKGCLPGHLLWRCSGRGCLCLYQRRGNSLDWRVDLLAHWISIWQLRDPEKELVYSEVARLEIFERLGMAHTCCCNTRPSFVDHDKSSYLYLRLCPDKQERERLHNEDSELALQLDDLVAHYENARKVHGGTIESFWCQWWQVLDMILPPLLPFEACKNRLLGWSGAKKFRHVDRSATENRAAREEAALKNAGYGGPEFQDFREVIRVHFSGRAWDPLPSDDADTEVFEPRSYKDLYGWGTLVPKKSEIRQDSA